MKALIRNAGILCLLTAFALPAEVLSVGPSGRYAKPCLALMAAKDADTIEIDAEGNYDGDVCAFAASNLLIRGVNGRARIDAAGRNFNGKGIWVMQGNNNIVENLEMSGARVEDRNGTPIRLEGVGLTLRRVYFHDNEDGLLTNSNYGDILIEYSEFERNGNSDGFAHNVYVNGERSLTVRFSTFRRAKIGHQLKSRASSNYIYYNRFLTEDADSSYELDLPNGGYAIVVGNVFQQGLLSDNQSMIGYMEEEGSAQTTWNNNVLLMAYNTIVNDGLGTDDTGPIPIFVLPDSKNKAIPYRALLVNNIVTGTGSLPNPAVYPNIELRDNLLGVDPMFVAPQSGDYRLAEGSPAIGAAGPLSDELYDLLAPEWQHQTPNCGQRRAQLAKPSPGAHEFGAADVNLSQPCTVALDTLTPRVALSRQQLTTSGTQNGRVLLDGVAPADGAEVQLVYSNPNLVKGPGKVLIPAGESSIPATFQFVAPAASASATITAFYREASADTVISFVIPVIFQPILNKVTLSASELTGGLVTTGNSVQLAAPAVAAEVVQLRSTRPDLATVPATATVAIGRTSAAFSLTTQPVTSAVTLQIIAEHRGVQITSEVRLIPLTVTGIALPGRVLGGPARHDGVVNISAPAPSAGLTLQLSSTVPGAVSVPAQVTIAGGAKSARFPVTINPGGAPVNGEIQATLGDKSVSTPVVATTFSITAVTLSPATLTGGASSGTNRVILNSPAPADQPMTILLISADPSLARMPDSITILPGLSSAPFQLVTSRVSAPTKVDLRAASETPLSGVSQRVATILLKP